MAIEPLKPEEVVRVQQHNIPEPVIDAWNGLIARHFRVGRAIIQQREAVEAILKAMNTEDRNLVFANHWLDIEDIYRNAGWQVEYDKPAYNETYEATFTFKPKGKDAS